MRNIAIALNPSKDKDGKILEKILLKLKSVFLDSNIIVLNSFDMSSIDFKRKTRFNYCSRWRWNYFRCSKRYK